MMKGDSQLESYQPGEALTERLGYWQGVLEDVIEAEQIDGFDPREMLDELNGLWAGMGLMGRQCISSGSGVWAEFVDPEDPEAAGTTLDAPSPRINITAGSIEQMVASSYGFVLESMTPNDPPRLWYMFDNAEEGSTPHPTVSHITVLRAFIDVNNCSIVPLRELEMIYSLDPDEYYDRSEPNSDYIKELLDQRSTQLIALLRSTKFRRTKHHKQLIIVDELIKDTEEKAGIAELPILLKLQYGYVSRLSAETDTESIDYEAIGLGGLHLSGICLAIQMAGRERLQHKPVRRDRDIISRHVGLCLSVELDNDTELYEGQMLPRGSIVHVPVSGQDVDMLFLPKQIEVAD